MWAGVVMAAEVAFPAAVSTGQHRDVEVLQHPPEGGDEGRDHADDLHGDAVQREPAAQRLAPVALLHDPTRGGHAHQPHHRQRRGNEEHGLRELDLVDEAEERERGQHEGEHGEQDHPGLADDVEDARDVDARDVLQIGLGLPAGAAGAQHHVIGNAEHPVGGGGPGDGQRDPVPQVGEGPEVDQVEDQFRPVQVLPPDTPLGGACWRDASGALRRFPPLRCAPIRATRCQSRNPRRAMTPIQAPFPGLRFRRLRRTAALRDLAQEHRLSVKDLIWPVFVTDVPGADVEVPSMPGVTRRTIDGVARAAEEAATLGIPAICLFPYTDPALKTETCEEAWNPENLSNRAVRAIKAAVPEVAVMTDVALDPYNALGHDGIVRDGVILNDETVAALVRMALAQAEAGADILGPSDMMDGRIGAMRAGLEAAGHRDVAILSYAAKYASAFYGP